MTGRRPRLEVTDAVEPGRPALLNPDGLTLGPAELGHRPATIPRGRTSEELLELAALCRDAGDPGLALELEELAGRPPSPLDGIITTITNRTEEPQQ